MANSPRKKKNIQDLKARLGPSGARRTEAGARITPPPDMTTPSPGVTPPPSLTPPPNLGTAGAPGGVAPPPFARPAAPGQGRDPFGAVGPSPQQRDVRLVIDDSAVDDSEIGRKKKGRSLILIGVGALVGLAIGAGIMSSYKENELFDISMSHLADIQREVQEASTIVEQADQHVRAALKAAQGAPGKAPKIAFNSIKELRGLKQPFKADQFARRSYWSIEKPSTVDDLFAYYNNVNLLWDGFERLANTTLSERRQKVLEASAEAATDLVTSLTGCVPTYADERFMCGLVYVEIPEQAEGNKVMVSLSKNGRQFEKEVYTGQKLSQDAEQYVILTNTERSVGVLGQRASEFAEFRRDLARLAALLQETTEIGGRLEQALGSQAKLGG